MSENSTMRIHHLVTIGSIVLLAGCDAASPVSSLRSVEGDEVDVAEVGFVDGPIGTPPGTDPRAKWIEWPDSVTSGVPFTVTVRTAGSRCRDVSRTEVSYEASDRSVVVVPYDAMHHHLPIAPDDTLSTGNPCPDDLRFLERRVTLQFDSPGTSTIVLRGRYFYQGQAAEQRVTVHVR